MDSIRLARLKLVSAAAAMVIALHLLIGTAAAFPSYVASEPPSVEGMETESYTEQATEAGHVGYATFVYADGIDEWVALVFNATSQDGVDRVSVIFSSDSRTLMIEAEDALHDNAAIVLVNGGVVDEFVKGRDGGLRIEVSEGVQYMGPTISDTVGGLNVYLFVLSHFSIQSITMAPEVLPPVVPPPVLTQEGLTTTGWALLVSGALLAVAAAIVALRRRE